MERPFGLNWKERKNVCFFTTRTKVYFKSRGTDCKILNIFANSHLMHVISILMDSKHHIDNFQSVLVAKTAKFSMKKNTEKFSVFLKNWSLWDNIYISVLPTLRGIQIYIFHPCFLTWKDTVVQNVPVIDEISVSVKNAEFLRNITILFSLIFSIWNSLFISLYLH